MTEILTESFCERCGTRYTFESAAPRRSRLGRVRTLSKGMKNFVLSDDASFSEAMAEARSEEEFTAVSHQLDAFHQTFNFCLTCRQYTCGDCWNTADGRCLTCAPIPGMEEPAYASAVFVAATPSPAPAEATNGAVHVDEAWPDEDLSSARLSRALGLDEAEAEADAIAGASTVDDTEFDFSAAVAAAAVVAGSDETHARPDRADEEPAVEAVAPEAPAIDLEPDLSLLADPAVRHAEVAPAVLGVAPGQSLEDAVAEYEARIAAAEAAAASQAADVPVEAAEPERVAEEPAPPAEPEPVALQPEPEPVLAEPEPEVAPAPEPVPAFAEASVAAIEAEPPVAVEPEPEPQREPAAPAIAAAAAIAATGPDVPDAARVDVVPQPTWPQPTPPPAAAPDVATPPTPAAPGPAPWLTVAPEESDSPQWPVAPAFPAPATRRDMPTTLAGRPLLPQADPSGIWAASAREVLTGVPQAPIPTAAPAPTAQPCVSCGLSLSANARFCRRCGTRQGA